MNKPHAAAYRKPATTPAIQAAIHHTIAWPTVAGSTQFPTIPRAALKWSSCLTSGSTLPPRGSTQRGPLYDPVTTLMGTHAPQIAPRAQTPMQPETNRSNPPRTSKGDTPVPAAGTGSAAGATNKKPDGDKPQPPSTLAQPNDTRAQTPMHPEAPTTLRNGNPRGNPNAAPRCGAKTRIGCPCRSPAMKNGRCRMHGGASTGPSAEGRARIAAARTTHGLRTASMRALDRSALAMKRRLSVLGAMVRARLRVEDLAMPIRQCRTTPRSSPPLPRKASKAERDRCFVLHELTAMDFTPPEIRSLLTSLGAGPKQPAQIPIHREATPQPLTRQRQRPRHTLRCRRHDPATPFPAHTNPHATWEGTGREPPNRHTIDANPAIPYQPVTGPVRSS